MDKSLPETTAVREVLESIKSTEVVVDEIVAPGAVSLKIEARGGGRVVAAEANVPLRLTVTVMGASGPMEAVATDVVLSSDGKLSGDVTLPASAFARGIADAQVQFTEAAQGVTLTARSGDLTAVTARFVVMPALVPFTGRGPLVANRNEIQGKTRKARAVLLEPPRNPGSEALAMLRARRPIAGLNSAGPNSKKSEDELGAGRSGDAGTNCLCCTMGAITGQTTTALVHAMIRDKLGPDIRAGLDESWKTQDKELVDAEVQRRLETLIADYGTMQDEKIWWRLESLKNFMTKASDKVPGEDVSGDAQLRGTRGLMVSEAKRRNAEAGTDGIRYKVVQDGVADTDPLKSKTYALDGEMQAQMGKYPDGTQFQVFVYGSMHHWLFAEKYNGKVVMEDYQKSKPPVGIKASASGPTGYTGDDVPHHPVAQEQSGVFTQGYFLAICPESFDASQAWAGNRDWPQVSM
ncbi:hypothetical protein [Pelomonas sp. Root1237]|uniref:hypothetical protein n=1 Tax=Pelomonas sp. Root1237 TaxID=1736434 RepID=UPI0006FEB440|nr:hypothetical protein [Pelomonas sp. Root1237]